MGTLIRDLEKRKWLYRLSKYSFWVVVIVFVATFAIVAILPGTYGPPQDNVDLEPGCYEGGDQWIAYVYCEGFPSSEILGNSLTIILHVFQASYLTPQFWLIGWFEQPLLSLILTPIVALIVMLYALTILFLLHLMSKRKNFL